jgi:hypothetical protein
MTDERPGVWRSYVPLRVVIYREDVQREMVMRGITMPAAVESLMNLFLCRIWKDEKVDGGVLEVPCQLLHEWGLPFKLDQDGEPFFLDQMFFESDFGKVEVAAVVAFPGVSERIVSFSPPDQA